jgi:putative ATPase
LISSTSGRAFADLSAVTAGVKDVREVIDQARERLELQGRGTVLFVDEVHRFSKSQQDALLPAVENGWVTLVAATTENPSFSVIAPLLSRSVIVTLEPLSDADIRTLIERAVEDPRGLAGNVDVDDEAIDALVRMSAGDARRALTALDAAALGCPNAIDVAAIEAAVMHVGVRYDRDGDQHYDVISAFIKSVRGSDPDAAVHYLARMIAAGEDPRFIARRLMILASEDIGMADLSVLPAAVAAAQAVAMIGMPEARIVLAHVTIQAALAPKSNSVIVAIDQALDDVHRGRIGTVPTHLRDAHYPGAAGLGHGVGYSYPHDTSEGVAVQQYLPDELSDRDYYRPSARGAEARWSDVLDRLDQLRAGGPSDAH